MALKSNVGWAGTAWFTTQRRRGTLHSPRDMQMQFVFDLHRWALGYEGTEKRERSICGLSFWEWNLVQDLGIRSITKPRAPGTSSQRRILSPLAHTPVHIPTVQQSYLALELARYGQRRTTRTCIHENSEFTHMKQMALKRLSQSLKLSSWTGAYFMHKKNRDNVHSQYFMKSC